MKNTKDRTSYPAKVIAMAPLALTKSLLGDLPKAALESSVERRVMGNKVTAKTLLSSIKGRGAGRLIGSGAGVLTFPLYAKAMTMIGSRDKSEQRMGAGLLLGSGVAYNAVKGTSEGLLEGLAANKGFGASMSGGLRLGGARSLVKMIPALLTSAAIAKARTPSADGKDGGLARTIKPIVYGAISGGAVRGAETAIAALAGGAGTKGLLRTTAAKALGGAAGGALGGALIDRLLKAVENIDRK